MKRSSRSSRPPHPSAPLNATWWIAIILAVLGVIFHFVSFPFLSQASFWLVAASAALLLLATRVKGL